MVPEGSVSYEPLFAPDTTEVVLDDGTYLYRTVRLVKVLRVTATQVVLPPAYAHQKVRRFDIFTGYEKGVGRSIGSLLPSITPATPEARERARRSVAIGELLELARNIERLVESDEFRKKNRSADELELSLASLKAAYRVLKA